MKQLNMASTERQQSKWHPLRGNNLTNKYRNFNFVLVHGIRPLRGGNSRTLKAHTQISNITLRKENSLEVNEA
jgi:hypothetical protein